MKRGLCTVLHMDFDRQQQRLADHGATAHQLMSWFVWRTLSEAARYTKEANRKRLAKEAGKLISGTGIGNPENQFAKTKRKPLKKRR